MALRLRRATFSPLSAIAIRRVRWAAILVPRWPSIRVSASPPPISGFQVRVSIPVARVFRGTMFGLRCKSRPRGVWVLKRRRATSTIPASRCGGAMPATLCSASAVPNNDYEVETDRMTLLADPLPQNLRFDILPTINEVAEVCCL